jgi:2'-5' RNA ligase
MKEQSEAWRLFIAIEMPSAIRQTVFDHIARLRQTEPKINASWSRENNLHLTLKFLGDTPTAKVQAVADAVRDVAQRFKSFDLTVGGCGAFPAKGRPQVLWIGINDANGNLFNLHRKLDAECGRLGFEREKRPFHPHLTIARLRNSEGSRRATQLHAEMTFPPQHVQVSEIVLFRSELLSEGPRHTAISRGRIGGEAGEV